MLGILNRKRARSRASSTPPRAPTGMRIYAVGDIHGRYDLLHALEQKILTDAADHAKSVKTVIYLGDYVDRGPESRAVVEHLSTRPLRGFNAIHLMGNHEQTLLGFLRDPVAHANWLLYGGLATLSSYGVDSSHQEAPSPLHQMARELRSRLPEHHLHFLEQLELYRVFEDYLFVHAGIRPGRPIQNQNPEDLLWIRDDFLRNRKRHAKFVVHGHQISDEPDVRDNRIGIDTGAFATGRLTCLVIDGEDKGFIST